MRNQHPTIVALSVLSLFLTSGCASIVKGTTQAVNVMTDPPGAACDLSRQGKVIAAVATTPASVTIDKSARDISILCRKEGFEETSMPLQSAATGWTFGNIIFGLLGGPIALGIDAASGAMTEYPSAVTIRLAPSQFASADARDQYYDPIVAAIESKAAADIAKARKNCKNGSSCNSRIKKIEDARDAELARVAAGRSRAAIGMPPS